MALLPRCVAVVAWTTLSVAPSLAQQISGTASVRANAIPMSQAAPSVSARPWFFQRYGIGTFGSPLGFGGRVAASLTNSLNLRVGASYFSFTMNRTQDGIPYRANVRLASEQAQVDWYPFHGKFHVSPGILFGNSNRVFGDATVPAGKSFTLNGVTYYSGAADPIQASGFVRFARTSPTLTVGWGNWIRHPEQGWGRGHWTFPFEAGVAFSGDPKTALDFSGVVCTDPGQRFCQNIATDQPVQQNVNAARRKLQNDANWARFYPIIAGGVVYRF